MNTPLRFPRVCLLALLVLPSAIRGAEQPETMKAETPPPSVLKKYDKNQNGVLDEKERGKWEADKAARREKDRAERAAMLERYDANKDGKLSEEEKVSAKMERERERSEKETEKLKERVAKAKAEREKAETEKAAREAAEKAAASAGKAAGEQSPAGPKEKGKAGEDDSMMMMSE